MRQALYPILFPRRLVGGEALLAREEAGLGIDFTDAKFNVGLGSVTVRHPANPTNNLSNAAVDSFLTQSGTSPKLVLWSDGLYRWTNHNLVLQSETFATTWSKTVAGDTASATGLVAAASSGFHQLSQAVTTIVGASYSVAVEVKANGYNYAFINFGGATDKTILIDLTTGLVSGYYTGGVQLTTYTVTDVGGGYWKIQATSVADVVATAISVGLRVAGGNFAAGDTGNGTSGILIRKAQFNRGTTPTTYHVTTSAAWYAVPIDYQSGFAAIVEPQATNLILQSQAFNNASWTKSSTTISADATTAPDGTATADKIIEAAATANHLVLQGFTSTASVNHAFSAYLKAGERTWAVIYPETSGGVGGGVWFNLATGVVGTQAAGRTGSIVSVGSGWYRCTVIVALADTSQRFYAGPASADNVLSYAGDGTSGIYAWQAQAELGSVATSPIPTFAATVTRSADLLNAATSTFPWSATTGALIVQATPYQVAAIGALAEVDDGTLNNRFTLAYDATPNLTFDVLNGGVSQASIQVGTPAANVSKNSGAAWAANDFIDVFAGTLGTPDVSGSLPTATTLRIGSQVSTNVFNGRIFQLTYLPRRMSNAQLQTKTP